MFLKFLFMTIGVIIYVEGAYESGPICSAKEEIFPWASDPVQNLICPTEEDIFPCTCKVKAELGLIMDCSDVVSDDELARVFTSRFPSHHFYSLIVKRNNELKTLHKGVFGKTTFEEIMFIKGSVEVVQPGALIGSASTLKKLQFRSHKVRSFPFEEVGYYRNLTKLYLGNNNFTSFPKIVSTSVKELNFAQNPIKYIPEGGLYGMPNLEIVYLYSCEIEEIFSGTFTSFRNLYYLTLTDNKLTELHPYSFELHTSNGRLFFTANNISKIAPKSMTGVSYFLNMSENNIVFLDEAIFRPLLERGAQLSIESNPLACGCDIAWLVRVPSLQTKIFGNSSCSDGTLLTALNAADYVMC